MRTAFISRFALLGTVALLLGGGVCNPDAYSMYVLEHYGSVQGRMVEVDDESFAVLDKPEEGRLLVAHSVNFYPMEEWKNVAATFLDRSGRSCAIDQAKKITPRQIEFFYICS